MRMSSLTAFAIFAMAAQTAPVAAEEGTFTACLMRDGRLAGGALGLEPIRPCRKKEREVRLQTGEVTRFNFEIVHDPTQIFPTGHAVTRTDEITIVAMCDGGVHLSAFIEGRVVFSYERRQQWPFETRTALFDETDPGGELPLALESELLWFEGDFMPVNDFSYILSLKLFGVDTGANTCQFSGESRLIELPETEVVE